MELDNSLSFNSQQKPQNQSLNGYDDTFSVLDRYGTYITDEEYITNPAIGRDEQIKELILVLLTPEKSAILIGKPGIGKTAIVEGLAYRIQKNDVPDALSGYKIVNIKTASLLGTMPNGETKVQKMIDELKTKEKLILFIDEIHMLIGSTESSSLDFANIFKEGLGRGSIKVIGATTTEEYERYILRDKAFTRRFQKIDVPEPNREETIKIMMGTLPKFEKQTGRKMKYTSFIQERIMSFIVDITSEYKRIFSLGSRYPDVCLTLLKQAFSYTVYDNRPYVDIFDVRKAIENSKNIYPDVIKKELPNFDKMFNDIMLEEKGEKPVEEWRKDGTLTRNELENGESLEKKSQKEKNSDDKLSNLGNVPQMVDKLEIKNSKPLSSIIDSKGKVKFAKVGNAAVSVGIKEKLNRNSNAHLLDDMLLSSDISVLKKEEQKDREYTNFVVTDEIREGVTDDYLFGKPIQSTVVKKRKNENRKDVKYKLGNKKNEGKQMWNDNNNNRMDISNQNFDKYQNYFHQNNMNNNQNNENQERINMLMGNNQGNYNNQNMNSPMGNMNMQGNMMPPPMNNSFINSGQSFNEPIQYNNNDTLFGAPMYGSSDNNLNLNNSNSFFGNNQLQPSNQNDALFGAPMYESSSNPNNEIPSIDNSNMLFDSMSNNMQIKNGEIVNEFPTFDTLNNLSNITASMSDGDSSLNQANNNFLNINDNLNNNQLNQPFNQPLNSNKNWTFVGNESGQNIQSMDYANKQPTLFQKNILDDAPKKQENNISLKENVTLPTNNKDYYEDMKSAEFVNFSELNKGNIKEEDTNKYMGVQVADNKPQFDLNLENNVEEDNKFDDFYE